MQNQNAIPQAMPGAPPLNQVCELEVSEPQITQSFEINVNIASIEQKYEDNGTFQGSLNYKISHRGSGTGGNLSPSFTIIIEDGRDVQSRKIISLNVAYTKEMNVKWNLSVNGRKFSETLSTGILITGNLIKPATFQSGLQFTFPGKFESVQGKITVFYIPSTERMRKLKLVHIFNKAELSEECEDLTILCKDKTFKFSKLYLSSISPVFKNMFKNYYVESENNHVKIMDVEPETIQAFKNTLCQDGISDIDLTPQLFIFAKRYLIEPLINVCREKLARDLSKDNLMDAIKAAYWNDDEELLKVGAKFLKEHLGEFNEFTEYDDFMKDHPDVSAKVLKLMMSQK